MVRPRVRARVRARASNYHGQVLLDVLCEAHGLPIIVVSHLARDRVGVRGRIGSGSGEGIGSGSGLVLGSGSGFGIGSG